MISAFGQHLLLPNLNKAVKSRGCDAAHAFLRHRFASREGRIAIIAITKANFRQSLRAKMPGTTPQISRLTYLIGSAKSYEG
jgi:hypothetical protein